MSDGAIVQVAPDKITYRASALGGCSKALVAARLEYEPLSVKEGSRMAALFRKGHEYEDLAIDQLKKDGWRIWDQQREVELPITKRISVVGHIDGTGIPGFISDRMLVEVKSQNQDAWDEFEKKGWEGGLFPKYKWQVSPYMLALQLPLALVRALRQEDGELTKFAVDFVDEPFYDLAEIRTRILLIESLAAKGVVPRECDLASFPCPYYYMHEELDRELLEDDEVIHGLAQEYADARRDEKAAKGRAEAAKAALRVAVGDSDKVSTSSGVKVSFYKGSTTSVDRDAMKEDGVLDKYIKTTTYDAVRVTLPKDDDGQDNGNV